MSTAFVSIWWTELGTVYLKNDNQSVVESTLNQKCLTTYDQLTFIHSQHSLR